MDAERLKSEMCDIGRRLWQRGLVAGTDGNLSIRLNANEFLCTPTNQSKGFLQPADICLVNAMGKQLAGTKQRSSEVLLHLEIMRARPDVGGVVHCHAPHATAFAIAGRTVPMGLMAEAEVFLGEIPLAPYVLPGTADFAKTVLPFVERTNVCLLANHGAVSYGANLEVAYNLMEVLDAYCRIVTLAEQLGPLHRLSEAERKELAKVRSNGGYAPPTGLDK